MFKKNKKVNKTEVDKTKIKYFSRLSKLKKDRDLNCEEDNSIEENFFENKMQIENDFFPKEDLEYNKKDKYKFFKRKHKKEEKLEELEKLEEFEDELDNDINETKFNEKDIIKQKTIMISTLSIFSIVVVCILLSVYLSFKVENVDISSNKSINMEEYKNLKTPTKTEVENKEDTEKGVDYFTRMNKIRDLHYDYNEKSIDTAIANALEEEKQKQEEEKNNKDDETETNDEKPSDTTNSSSSSDSDSDITNTIPKLPKNEAIRDTVKTMNELLDISLGNATSNYGGNEKLELSSEKVEKLNAALKSKGTSYEEVKLYSLSPTLFSKEMEGLKIEDYAVATNGSLKGEIIYIGNNVEGFKDDDGTIWFGYNIYK